MLIADSVVYYYVTCRTNCYILPYNTITSPLIRNSIFKNILRINFEFCVFSKDLLRCCRVCNIVVSFSTLIMYIETFSITYVTLLLIVIASIKVNQIVHRDIGNNGIPYGVLAKWGCIVNYQTGCPCSSIGKVSGIVLNRCIIITYDGIGPIVIRHKLPMIVVIIMVDNRCKGGTIRNTYIFLFDVLAVYQHINTSLDT